MDPDRRDVLTVLGVVGAGGAASALFLAEDSESEPAGSSEPTDDPPSPETRPNDPDGYAAAVERAGSETGETPALPEEQTFDYDPVDVAFEDRWLGRFVASPAAGGSGDRLRVTPGTGSAADAVTIFRRWLGVPDNQWGETALADESVTLRGGDAGRTVAVLGTVDGRDLVVGARAVDDATLGRVVSSWTLPER